MTTYKKPLFFNADTAAVSELSKDIGLDLGLVARSILADAAVTVGSSGTAGTVSIKNASNVERVTLDASDASAEIGQRLTVGNNGDIGLFEIQDDSVVTRFRVEATEGLEMRGGDGTTTVARITHGNGGTLELNSSNGGLRWRAQGSNATLTGYSSSDMERITLDAQSGNIIARNETQTARVQLVGSLGQVLAKADNGADTIVLDGGTATATFGAVNTHGTMSVNGFLGLETIRLNGGAGSGPYSDPSLRVNTLAGGDAIVLQGNGYAMFGGNAEGVISIVNSSYVERVNIQSNNDGLRMFDESGALSLQMRGDIGSILLSGAASKISGLVTAEITDNLDAANKQYVDSLAQGLAVKGACHVSSQGNLADLATTTEVDGHTLSEGERVLVRYQTNAVENGIYRFDGTGLVRAADFSVGLHVAGAFTFIQFGTNADQGWVCTADNATDVVGTDPLPWTQFSAAGVIEPGDGLQLIGTVMSVKLDGSTLSASALGTKVLGVPSLFTIDGTATSANVTATNLGTLVDGASGDAKALHHLSADAEYLPAATGLAAAQACVINSSSEAATAGTTTSGAYVIGVVESIASGTARIIRGGFATGVLTGATAGAPYYVQADGTLGTALPTSGRVILVGFAKNATDLHVQVRDLGTIVSV